MLLGLSQMFRYEAAKFAGLPLSEFSPGAGEEGVGDSGYTSPQPLPT